uniref:Uncharacterized protein n=1 Tax=Ixodes ricinus TaxID=34613 RepID=A0A6B0UMQ1_IXORI
MLFADGGFVHGHVTVISTLVQLGLGDGIFVVAFVARSARMVGNCGKKVIRKLQCMSSVALLKRRKRQILQNLHTVGGLGDFLVHPVQRFLHPQHRVVVVLIVVRLTAKLEAVPGGEFG